MGSCSMSMVALSSGCGCKTLLPNLFKRRKTNVFLSHNLISPSKRTLALSLLLWAFPTNTLSFSLPPNLLSLTPILTSNPQDQEQHQLERYTDQMEGFTLLIPSSWLKVDKAGATVLFEEGSGRGNNVGVVVNPVRLSSLGDFGSPQFVADKLIQAEKRKESTKDAEVVGVAERLGAGGLQVYEFEYMVDSTRGGMKRIFTAAFVASKRLYLLNISYSDRPDNPIDAQTRTMLEKIIHSFDTASSSI
ncbi:photosystem II reaction center PsbP family protein [Tasmannia lanceolata]|uniref:photosystem II reaction center PsbP family protein n=1 Tax=Tasmannia lanceolata TaxID=3420 RepID=UPI0040648AFF